MSLGALPSHGHLDVVNRLLELDGDRRVDPTSQNNYAFKLAAGNGHLDVVNRLLELGGDRRVYPTATNNWAIRYAAENGHANIVQLLLDDDRVRTSLSPMDWDRYNKVIVDAKCTHKRL